MANEIADEIKTKGDWRRREYGAVVYYNTQTGIYRRDDLDRGTSSDVDLTVSRSFEELIVALVHSHPRNGGDAPSDDDWDEAEMLFDTGRAITSSFSHYILSGDDRKLYEFDENDKNNRNGRTENNQDAQGQCDE